MSSSRMVQELVHRKHHLVETARFDGIDDLLEVESASGRGESRAAHLMPAVHDHGVQRQRLGRVEPPVARRHTELPQPHHQLPDHRVHPRAEPAAGDDGRPHIRRVEADGSAGPGAVVGNKEISDGGGGGQVEEDVAEDEVGRRDVEAVGGAVEGVTVDGVGEGGGVREVVRDVWERPESQGRERELVAVGDSSGYGGGVGGESHQMLQPAVMEVRAAAVPENTQCVKKGNEEYVEDV